MSPRVEIPWTTESQLRALAYKVIATDSGKAAEQEAPGSCRPPGTNCTGRPLSATHNSGVCPRLPGGDWRVNCSQAGSSSAPSTAAATHLPTPAPGQAAVHPFLEHPAHSLQHLEGQKGPCPPNSGHLCSAASDPSSYCTPHSG